MTTTLASEALVSKQRLGINANAPLAIRARTAKQVIGAIPLTIRTLLMLVELKIPAPSFGLPVH